MVTGRTTKQQPKKHHILVIIIILLVIAIISLLLVNFFNFKPIETTRKINIINLTSCYSCYNNNGDASVPETDEDNKEGKSSQPNPEKPENSSSENSKKGPLTVFDDDIIWGISSEINIFEDSLYDNRHLIAPHSTNTYEFIIRNSTGFNVDYDLYFDECNPQNINMKYRLIHDGRYLAGSETEWVSFDELNQYANRINHKSEKAYYLEWRWFDSENDTEIGEMDYADYKLTIKFKGTQTKNAE